MHGKEKGRKSAPLFLFLIGGDISVGATVTAERWRWGGGNKAVRAACPCQRRHLNHLWYCPLNKGGVGQNLGGYCGGCLFKVTQDFWSSLTFGYNLDFR